MNEWNNVDMRYRLKHCQWHPNKWRWRWRPFPHPQHSQTSLWDTEEKEKNARQNALWTFQSIRILPCTHTIRSCWTKMEWNEQVNERGANWNWNLGLVDWLYTFICFALFCFVVDLSAFRTQKTKIWIPNTPPHSCHIISTKIFDSFDQQSIKSWKINFILVSARAENVAAVRTTKSAGLIHPNAWLLWEEKQYRKFANANIGEWMCIP